MPMNRGLIRALPREFPSFRGLTINGPLRSVYYGDNQSPQFSGPDNVVIGDSAGQSMRATGLCVVIGSAAGTALVDTANQCVYVGYQAGNTTTTGTGGVAIGYQAVTGTTFNNGIAIGLTATVGASNAIAIGQSTQSTGSGGTVIGNAAQCSGGNSVTIGNSANAGSGGSSVAVGSAAGQAGVSGAGCVFIGFETGKSNTSGVNTMLGFQSGLTATSGNATTTGTRQTLIGYNTGANTSTQLNDIVCVGDTAQVNGSSCVAIGSAANAAVDGVSIGYQAGGTGITGTGNIFIGYRAGLNTTSGTQNIFIGTNAGNGTSNTANTSCIVIGGGAGIALTNATSITVMGVNAGSSITTGGSSVMIGFQSGQTATSTNATTTAVGQTLVGYNTGQSVASASVASYITCLGYQATAGGSGAAAIGTDSGGNGATTTNANEIKLGTANHTTTVIGLSKILAHGITSGALPTTTFVSGTGKQIDTTTDRHLVLNVSITLATDTIQIQISPDNTTYSSLGTYTPGVAASNDMYPITVPAAWYVKITLTGSAAITTATYY